MTTATVTMIFNFDGPPQVNVETVGEWSAITIASGGQSIQLLGDHQDLLQLVVDADTGLNRERDQREQQGENGG